MGCVQTTEKNRLLRRSEEIDKQLRIDALKYCGQVKLLLLGAGESGKSTVVKQMKYILTINSINLINSIN